MTRPIAVVLAVELCCFACGGGNDPDPYLKNIGDSGACTKIDDQGYRQCIESIEPDLTVGSLKAICESDHGTYSSNCPEGSLFICHHHDGNSTTTQFAYHLEPGTEGLIQQACVTQGGTPGKP
jgi:hypothetical protein